MIGKSLYDDQNKAEIAIWKGKSDWKHSGGKDYSHNDPLFMYFCIYSSIYV